MRNNGITSGSADFVWESHNLVITAHLKQYNGQLIANLWVTKLFPSGFVHLVRAQELLLESQSEKSSGRELDKIVAGWLTQDATNKAEPTGGYQMSFLPGKNEREGIALEHLALQSEKSALLNSDSSVILQTARDYTLLVEFGIAKPSAVIARKDLLQAKSIQQRIYLAREQGILKSHGKGRTTSTDERTKR